jgi:hypothetical protein
MINKAALTVKSTTSGGISMLIANALGDTEFVMLLMVGAFASITSFLYDYFHKKDRAGFTFVDCCILIKFIFYGIPMMLLVYYVGMLNTPDYIVIPVSVWGGIAMLSAGSSVAIVDFLTPTFKKITVEFLQGFFDMLIRMMGAKK